jgi:hypothetical protein
MAIDNSKLGPEDLDPNEIETYLAMARLHGEASDTDAWMSDLEDIARAAWRLMTEEQKASFRAEPEILAITDAFGDFADNQNADF